MIISDRLQVLLVSFLEIAESFLVDPQVLIILIQIL